VRKFCGNCGAEQQNPKGDFCDKCGAPFDRWNKANFDLDTGQESWGTVGAAKSRLLALKLSENRKLGFGCSGTVFAIVIVLIIVIVIGNNSMLRVNSEYQIRQETQLANDKVKNVASVLQECAINSINDVKRNKKLDPKGSNEKAYQIITPDTNQIVMYLNKDGSVASVTCYKHYLYHRGKLLGLERDYVIMQSDLKDFKKGAVSAVNECLDITDKSPKYPDVSEWKITQDDSGIYLKSYVEYQGLAGQTVHKNFKITCESDKSKINTIEIDGKTYHY